MALLHFSALWWNGRDRLFSLLSRSATLAGHVMVCVRFSWYFFAGGALLGILLYGFLLPWFLVPLFGQSFTAGIAVLKGVKQCHG